MSKPTMQERNFSGSKPFVDWMLYLLGRVDALPAPARAEPCEAGGSIIIVQPEALQADDPER